MKQFLKDNMKILIYLASLISIALLIGGLLAYFLWLRPLLRVPMGESLSLPTLAVDSGLYDPEGLPLDDLAQIRYDYLKENSGKPVCGSQQELLILAVGIDYRGTDYLYGLADVIRVVRVDFSVPQVNVVTLPRSLLVNVPTDRIQTENPILLNQAYFFGTAGMQYYSGTGFGAGSLAETIQYNFGVSAEQYLVVDFQGFIQLIDAMGGIEVDLPESVDDLPRSFFPAGKQVLNGEQALQLARIREKYSDRVRMDNQTLILQAIFRKLQEPAVLLQLPGLVSTLQDSVITDGSPDQAQVLICLLQKLDDNRVYFASPPPEVVSTDWAYIPSLSHEMEVLRWDAAFSLWFYESLYAQPE